MASVVYIPVENPPGTIVMVGRVYDSGESEYIADDGKGWKADPTGIFYRRKDDPAYGWISAEAASAIIAKWGAKL